jgi:hypothetical protein
VSTAWWKWAAVAASAWAPISPTYLLDPHDEEPAERNG